MDGNAAPEPPSSSAKLAGRFRALTMPVVTEPLRPNGEPSAITGWPILRLPEDPKVAAGDVDLDDGRQNPGGNLLDGTGRRTVLAVLVDRSVQRADRALVVVDVFLVDGCSADPGCAADESCGEQAGERRTRPGWLST